MAQILAKSKRQVQLNTHSDGMRRQLDVLEDLVIRDRFPQILKLLRTAVLLHDIGKVSPSMQTHTLGNWDYVPDKPFPSVPHSIFSLCWIDENKVKEMFPDEQDQKILYSAIAFHHWRNNFYDIILGKNKDFKNAANLLLEDESLSAQLLGNLIEEMRQFDGITNLLSVNRTFINGVRSGSELQRWLVPPYHSYLLPRRLNLEESDKVKLTMTLGLLQRLDHFTSYIQEEDIEEEIDRQPVPRQYVRDAVMARLKKVSPDADSYWQLEEVEDMSEKENTILVAPTGSGKTEFAFLWAAGAKFLFTLPLRSAVNAAFLRSQTIFGFDKTALLHSDADVFFLERSHEQKNGGSEDGNDWLRVLDFSRHLAYPVSVATGDQFFPASLKYPGFEKIYATLAYSALVIDEVQAYDPRAAAIVVKLIEDITRLGGKVLLMTATLPPFVKKEIENRVGKTKEISKYVGLENLKKHRLWLRHEDLAGETVLGEIIEKAGRGKRILVIANTVKKAQGIREKLAKLTKDMSCIDIHLLHSRYTLEDRNRLENEVIGKAFRNPKPEFENTGKILVATQVVEASLDIDADLLYTEIAPLDSLIQRMGRISRRIYPKAGLAYECDADPNVLVFVAPPKKGEVEKGQVESGKGHVYYTDLLSHALAQLLGRMNILSQEEMGELKKDKLKGKHGDQNLIAALADKIPDHAVLLISETDKLSLVDNDVMDGDVSQYMSTFLKTLDVLDAGYMSDRKEEAARLFREIFTIPAIPANRIDKFKEDVREWLAEGDISYTTFKKMVLARHVVQVYYRGDYAGLRQAGYLVSEFDTQTSKQNHKLRKYLKDLYIAENVKYDETETQLGLTKEDREKTGFGVFLD